MAGWGALIGCGLAVAASLPVSAAIPTSTAVIAVSAVVTAPCDNTACRTIPRVVSYGPARGALDAPSFDLSLADSQRVMTITY